MMHNNVPYRVLIPKKIFDEARDRDHFKQMLAEYMRIGYPNYIVKAVKDGFAICERRE